jgi:predicted amidophosphoribosyltransferase
MAVVGRGGHLCWDCLADLPVIQHPFCRVCGDPVDGRVEQEYTCAWCMDHAPRFDRARSAVRYRGFVRRALGDFKYRGMTHF